MLLLGGGEVCGSVHLAKKIFKITDSQIQQMQLGLWILQFVGPCFEFCLIFCLDDGLQPSPFFVCFVFFFCKELVPCRLSLVIVAGISKFGNLSALMED